MDRLKEQEYSLIRDKNSNNACDELDDATVHKAWQASKNLSLSLLLAIFLIISVGMNAVTVTRHFMTKSYLAWDTPSLYSGLRLDNPTVFNWKTEYGPHGTNETRQDELWESLRISPGVIAVNDEFVRTRGLMNSTRFPWDSSLSIYLLAGYHKLHCLIRRWIVATERNTTRIDNWHHILHCLDTLRQNILCEADDTPLYNTGKEGKQAGPEEVRHCRSWEKMEEWAVQNSGCFGYVNETGDESGGLKYYKYCPRGSPFLPAVRKHFGYPDDWFEEPIEQVPPY